MLFFLGLAVVLAFGHQMFDAATAVRWAVLAVGTPLAFLLLGLRPRKEIILWALAVLCFAALTIFWAADKLTAADELIHLAILMGVFCLGASLPELTPIWRGLVVGVSLCGILTVAQRFGFDWVGQAVPPAGLFMNKNMMAEAGAIAVVCMVAYRWWWALPFLLAAWLLPVSMAAMGGFWLAAALYLSRDKPWAGSAIIAVLSVGAICAFAFHSGSADVRIDIWQSALGYATPFGYGVGSFAVHFPGVEFAHSELIQLIFELGIFALPLFLLLYFALGQDNEPERSILVAVLGISFFSFPFHIPVTAFAAALAAGHLVARRYSLRDVHVSRAATFVQFGKRKRSHNDGSLFPERFSGAGLPAVFTSARNTQRST